MWLCLSRRLVLSLAPTGARSDPDSEKDIKHMLKVYVSQSIPIGPLKYIQLSHHFKNLVWSMLNQVLNDFEVKGSRRG